MTPVTDATFTALGLDLARVIHLFAMAIAVGTVAFTDFSMLRRVQEPIRPAWAEFLGRTHHFVVWVTVVIWLSGLCLIWMRTDFQMTAFTPKLWIKLAVVTGLILTAVGIRRSVIPHILKGAGGTLLDLPWRSKRVIALYAGFSIAGWTSALILGGSALLKTASLSLLFPLFSGIYVAIVCAAVVAAWYVHRCYDNPLDRLDRGRTAHY